MSNVTSSIQAGSSYTTISLSKLCIEIARSVAQIGQVAVEGEVKGCKKQASGMQFFSLIDKNHVIQVSAMPRFAAKVKVEDGDRVIVYGSVAFAQRFGQLRLEAVDCVPVGEGAVERALAEIRKRLEHDGLTRRPRKKIPVLPKAIGVITGAEAAVIGDIKSVASERFPGYPLKFKHVAVSGPEAPNALIGALIEFEEDQDIEVVIVARGGGEPSTLFPFSSEELCRKICSLRYPVVTAIGHEQDHPLCDLVSDLACNTPSLAAMKVVPSKAELTSYLDMLTMTSRDFLQSAREQRVAKLASFDILGSLMVHYGYLEREFRSIDLFGPVSMKFLGLRERLERIDPTEPLVRRYEQCISQLNGLGNLAEQLSPTQVLNRGYAIVRDSRGTVVRSTKQVSIRERLSVEVSDGAFSVTIGNSDQTTL